MCSFHISYTIESLPFYIRGVQVLLHVQVNTDNRRGIIGFSRLWCNHNYLIHEIITNNIIFPKQVDNWTRQSLSMQYTILLLFGD